MREGDIHIHLYVARVKVGLWWSNRVVEVCELFANVPRYWYIWNEEGQHSLHEQGRCQQMQLEDKASSGNINQKKISWYRCPYLLGCDPLWNCARCRWELALASKKRRTAARQEEENERTEALSGGYA